MYLEQGCQRRLRKDFKEGNIIKNQRLNAKEAPLGASFLSG